MATDATGTPTPLGIPKFNTSVDAPSGLGGNAQMDSIDALLQAHVGFQTAGIVIYGNKLLSTDANVAFSIAGDGTHKWGPGGASVTDVTLNRKQANSLQILTGNLWLDWSLIVDQTNSGGSNKLYWGSALDTNLYRPSAGVLKTDGTFNAVGGLQVNGTSIFVSPAFTGTPTAPTVADADNSTSIATTAWVRTRISNGSVSSVFSRTGAIVATSGDYTAAQVTNAFDKSSSSNQLMTGTGAIGYGTGAGGAVTQTTSFGTGVTLNTATGQITTFTSTMAGATVSTFTVTCSAVGADDTVVVSWKSAGWNTPVALWVNAVAAGSFNISMYNLGGLSSSANGVINYTVHKGSHN